MFYVIAIEDRDEQHRTFLVWDDGTHITSFAKELAADFGSTFVKVQTLDDAFDRNDVVELVTF